MNKVIIRYLISASTAATVGVLSFMGYSKLVKVGKRKSETIIQDIPEDEIEPDMSFDDED